MNVPMRDESAGVWIAHYHDWSGMAAFAVEIDALRYAVKHSMQVRFVEYGNDLRGSDS